MPSHPDLLVIDSRADAAAARELFAQADVIRIGERPAGAGYEIVYLWPPPEGAARDAFAALAKRLESLDGGPRVKLLDGLPWSCSGMAESGGREAVRRRAATSYADAVWQQCCLRARAIAGSDAPRRLKIAKAVFKSLTGKWPPWESKYRPAASMDPVFDALAREAYRAYRAGADWHPPKRLLSQGAP